MPLGGPKRLVLSAAPTRTRRRIGLVTMFSLTSTLLVVADNGHHDMDWEDWILMALFWTLLIVGIVFVVRQLMGHGAGRGRSAGGDDPLAILDRSLAEGKLSPEQYRERRSILSERDQS